MKKSSGTLGFKYAIQELPEGIEAAMDPREKLVILSPATYDNLADGIPRARFTGAHEIAHVILHAKYLQHRIMDGGNLLRLNRGNIKPFRDPECQANAFAAALLMPTHHMVRMLDEGANVRSIAEIFQVSFESAGYRVDGLDKYL
jgi:Zn-dependent peptidase ImmA (M78 family)